jgi:hypothetical protein
MCLNATYSKACTGKYLSGNFPIQSGLKQDALSPLLFSFPLAYANRKVQESQVGQKLNVTYQLLVYVDDVNLLGDNINTIKRNRNFYASKEVGLEVNTEKTKYMLLSCHQYARQIHDIRITDTLKMWHSSNIWE